MALWIRTQDRLTLKKVEEVYIAVSASINSRNIYQIITDLYENSGVSYTTLGEYKTKERALEVLDEIENFIANNAKIEGTYKETDLFLKNIIASNMVKIYNMPKE